MKVDCLIIGQGIAGSVLAWQLHKRGYTLAMVDENTAFTSSKIAAGMFNPINTKRFTVAENALQQFALALNEYAEMEQQLGLSFVHQNPIYHVFGSVKEANDYSTKLEHPFFAQYTNPNPTIEPSVVSPYGAFETQLSGWIDLPTMLSGIRSWLEQTHIVLTEKMNFEDLVATPTEWVYKDIRAANIISCEGIGLNQNPYFNSTSIIPCRGEVITFSAPTLALKRVVKKGIYIVPLGNGLFKCGSTYKWENGSTELHPADVTELLNKVKSLIETEIDITLHNAACAIRPTTINRQAFWLQHIQYKNMYAINGLGTKGVVNGPTIIRQFLDTVPL
ncbi:MAG: FAD-binding oxidoreductase [Bacteroidia bacterium]|jgi:glycine/D-amino acid oxidase-like deaminating enzyme|nr:FAD-binding oxidoreductase [Bacteroidia bacterium]